MNNKLNVLRFALAGGIWLGVLGFGATILALFNFPGFLAFGNLITQFYGSYGYSISWTGSIIGAFWGFAEGFIHLGFFAIVYNWLNKK
jgi:hypothetical protein